MNVVVDTNVIFSALLNSNGAIGDLLFNSDRAFNFYSCSYMRVEIGNHWERLKKISGLTDAALHLSYTHLLTHIRFVNEEIILPDVWLQAEQIAQPIDSDDTDFVALTLFLDGWLWTGDKVLYNGLKQISFNRVLTTSELIQRRVNLF